jgi:cysteinyl-tRNA synthetase
LRHEKLWAFSDRIRDGLLHIGVAIEDKKEGTTWKKTSADQ